MVLEADGRADVLQPEFPARARGPAQLCEREAGAEAAAAGAVAAQAARGGLRGRGEPRQQDRVLGAGRGDAGQEAQLRSCLERRQEDPRRKLYVPPFLRRLHEGVPRARPVHGWSRGRNRGADIERSHTRRRVPENHGSFVRGLLAHEEDHRRSAVLLLRGGQRLEPAVREEPVPKQKSRGAREEEDLLGADEVGGIGAAVHGRRATEERSRRSWRLVSRRGANPGDACLDCHT
mmetsp:Transcript_4238/g.12025  ORF Transcript_4238/g.12025 Transcript_4238/m.12025 type:complete len:234 (+) Transcript_4238:2181-2882(+)